MTILWNTSQNAANCIYRQKLNFSWYFPIHPANLMCIIYFSQLRSDRMGAVVIDFINTAHDAVKYCTNTPNRYKLPWIKCLFIYTFLGSILQHYDQYSLYFSLKHSIDPIWADIMMKPAILTKEKCTKGNISIMAINAMEYLRSIWQLFFN